MGFAYQSELRRWDVLSGLCQQMGAKSFVEVGCKEGRTSGTLLLNLTGLHVTAIDPWAPVANSDEDYTTWDFEAIEREFWDNIGEGKPRCTMLRLTSAEAAVRIAPASIDMVFIDAGHDYENALTDIHTWWPKIREGGYLCGHDYQHKFPGVMRAVAKAFPLLRVAVCPDSVWVVQKEADLQLRVAA